LGTDEHSAATPQPKNLYWKQMNTDKHRFCICKKRKDKRHDWTRMNADKHG
jgi:hypothetical protein